ncbi:MAG TPA: hypothetical protein VGV14_16585 [Rhodanobacter sp.]|nr:hypothetical protein [Rhodanobacter sp.]
MKGIAWIVATILLALIGGIAWGRLRPPSDAQARALALLQQDHRPTQGHNAWATFWLLDYDLPANAIDSVYARERQHLIDWTSRIRPDAPSTLAYDALVAKDHPKLPPISPGDRALLCHSADADCLGKVRGQAASLRAVLAQQATRLARLRSITPEDYLWEDTPFSPYAPQPAFLPSEDLLRTSAALDFVDGQRERGLTAICRNAQVIRQLHAHTNSLIGAMLMVGWMDAAERLFAGMLTELPVDQAVPASCTEAFAPVTLADVDMCAPMQHEFAWVLAGTATVDPARASGLKRWWLRATVDMQGIHRLIAPHYAWSCQADVREAMLADRKLSTAQAPIVRYDVFDAVANPIGVILARIASPDYATYMNRNEDYAAGLRLTRLLLAGEASLSSTAFRSYLEQHFSTLTPAGARPLQFDPDGRHLRMPYYSPRPHKIALVLPIAP